MFEYAHWISKTKRESDRGERRGGVRRAADLSFLESFEPLIDVVAL